MHPHSRSHFTLHFPGDAFWRDLAILLAMLAWLLVFTAKAEPPKKVANLNRDALVLGWYNSPQWNDLIRDKKMQQAAAVQQGDLDKAQALRIWMKKAQDTAHRQMFDGAAIDDLFVQLKPCFDQIKKSGGYSVILIVPNNGAVQENDVTEQVLVYLKATDRTRKMIADLKK